MREKNAPAFSCYIPCAGEFRSPALAEKYSTRRYLPHVPQFVDVEATKERFRRTPHLPSVPNAPNFWEIISVCLVN